MHSFCRTFARTNHRSFSDVLLRHSLASDLSLFSNLLQTMLSRDAGDGRDERQPSMRSLDLVKAQQQASVQAWLDGAHVSFDLAPDFNRHSIRRHQRLG